MTTLFPLLNVKNLSSGMCHLVYVYFLICEAKKILCTLKTTLRIQFKTVKAKHLDLCTLRNVNKI